MEEKTHARKPDPGDAAAPKRRFQWLYFMVGAVALLLCLAMICWFSVLPRLVEQRLVGALKGLGFDHVSLQVDEVGLGEARITNICLGGKDPVAIGVITARYKLAEAMGGQLGKVDIEGLELKAVVGKNGLRFPQLENLSLSDEPMDQLPFEEISIRSAKLFLENPDGASHIIPVEAKLTRLGSKTMAMQLSAQGKSATLGADVSIGEETVEVSGGTLTLECQELPVPGLSTSLRDVSLRLNFEGKISGDNITVALKTGSDVSAGLNKLSVGDDIDVSELRLTGKIVDPLTLESTADGFKAMGPGGQVQGRLEAQTINWRKDGMQVEARALKTEIVASKDGLVFALQKGTELDWMPGDDFLSSRGIVAKDLRVTLHKLDKPAQLHVTTNGSWIAKIPEAKLGIHSGAMSMEEGNFTCESVNADLNIQADASANNFSVNLLSTANVSTGKIRYEVFQDAPSLEIERTEWKLSAHDGHPAVTSLYDEDIKFAGHVSTENMKVQQGGWKLSALPLNVSLVSNDDGKELSDWRDTHLEFSPAEDWLDGKGIKADSLVLAVDNIPSLKIPQEDNWDEWSLTKSNVQLTADANSIKLIEAGVEAEYVKVSMNLEIAFDEAGLDLDLEKQAGIEVKGVRYERDGQVIQVEARQWNLRKNGSKPLVHLDTKTSELDLYGEVNSKDVSVSGNVVNMGPIPEIQMPIEIRNEKIEFTAKCTLAEGLTAKIEGKITDKKQGYTLGIPLSSETGTALGGLIPALRDLNLPGRLGAEVAITNNADAPELWKFGVTNLTFGASPIPPIHGESRLTDGGQQFSAECELINGLTAKVEGNRTGKKQSYTLRIPPTKISDKSALGNLFHELKGIEIGGMIGLEAHSDGTKSQVQLSLKDCSLASSDLSAIVGGLSGTIRIDGISPFTTAMAQRITVNSAQLGNLELVNGLTVFRLESGGIFVEEERWSLKQDRDGYFVARNFRLTPGQPVKADIEVRDLDLGIWLGLLTDGQVVASGKLSGRVPVTLNERGTKLPVRVGDGAFLETKEPGKLQFRSAKWAGDWLETVDPRFRTDSVLKELRQSVVEALQDFSYSSIKFHYDEKTDNMLVAVRGEGKNRHGSVVKFDPTINIKPIASWVNEAYNDLVLLAHLENLVNRDLDNLFGD